MAGVILVILDHPDAAGALLGAAQQLAAHSGATRINALVVRAPPETQFSPSEEVLSSQRETTLREDEAERAASLRASFDAWATNVTGIVTDWIDIDGIVELQVEERGRRADCVVIERPSQHDYGTSWQALRAALFTTDRPVLVVPADYHGELGRRIAIAWRDDERAAKAVMAALRGFRNAEQVFVLAGMRAGGPSPELPPILREHGVTATLHILPVESRPFGAGLLRAADELGADVLVMGAYQHTPLREFLFGGVTRHMLHHANRPVLMRH